MLEEELKLLEIYNKEYVNSFFDQIYVKKATEFYIEFENLNYLKNAYCFFENTTYPTTGKNHLTVYFSEESMKLIEEKEEYFSHFKKILLLHEIIEAYIMNTVEKPSNSPHNLTNKILNSYFTLKNEKKQYLIKNWKWENIKLIIIKLEEKGHSLDESVNHIFPKLELN